MTLTHLARLTAIVLLTLGLSGALTPSVGADGEVAYDTWEPSPDDAHRHVPAGTATDAPEPFGS